jgi:hypothetical protein
MLYMNDRSAEAIHQFELASARDPDFMPVYNSLSVVRLGMGDVDEAERLWHEEYVPRIGFDEETQARWRRGGAARYEAIRNRDAAAYAQCCAGFNEPGDWLLVGDTARAVQALRDRYQGRPRYDVNVVYPVWQPSIDGLRDHPGFQEALAEVLDYMGLPGADLTRDSGDG